ncbi:MAG: YkgJ family cysteine cluster protein [Planctomycetota bacterium]
MPLEDALPDVYAALADELGSLATRATCRSGCSACCHQLVPVAPAELRRMRKVVDDMSTERQGAVADRFAKTRDTLDELGLLDLLDAIDGSREGIPGEIAADLGRRWAMAKVACPFLEDDETCGIYHDRPLACRAKLVASEPAHCAGDGRGVVPLTVQGKPPVAALAETQRSTWMPLTSLMAGQVPDNAHRTSDAWRTAFARAR